MLPASRIALRSQCQLSSTIRTSPLARDSTYTQGHISRAYTTLSTSSHTGPNVSPSKPCVTHPAPPTSTRNMSTKKDWSATQYLKFNNQRTRPVHDLIAQIAPLITTPHPRIYDLGCGPGNSTEALLSAFPSATITGIDSSPDMLAKATAALPTVQFTQGDISAFAPAQDEPVALLFSNAVFHWLRTPSRIATLTRLFTALPAGGVLAIQVPDNYTQPSHVLMRDVALTPAAPWSAAFADAQIGRRECETRPDLDPIEAPSEFYNALSPLAGRVDVWRTEYQHVLEGKGAVVEWVKGTGLQPFLNRMEEGVRGAFLDEYERRVGEAYGGLVDGKVMLAYPRLFVVAVRK